MSTACVSHKIFMILYYRILKKKHRCYVPKEEIILNGITSFTKSNTIPIVGLGNPMITGTPFDEKVIKPSWLVFDNAIPCWLEKPKEDYVCFSQFTDKIRVFDGDVSYDIVEQLNYQLLEGLDEQEVFETGKNLEKLYIEYWASMMPLPEYINSRPYLNSEVFIFEPILPKYLRAK